MVETAKAFVAQVTTPPGPTAPKITIDRQNHKLYCDGVEFPWVIEERGIEVENLTRHDCLPVVLIPIIATDVSVMPRDQ